MRPFFGLQDLNNIQRPEFSRTTQNTFIQDPEIPLRSFNEVQPRRSESEYRSEQDIDYVTWCDEDDVTVTEQNEYPCSVHEVNREIKKHQMPPCDIS